MFNGVFLCPNNLEVFKFVHIVMRRCEGKPVRITLCIDLSAVLKFSQVHLRSQNEVYNRSSKMKIKISIKKPRNPNHDNPLMRKGGVHEKSKKSKRRLEKQNLKNEWSSLIVFLNSVIKEFHLIRTNV